MKINKITKIIIIKASGSISSLFKNFSMSSWSLSLLSCPQRLFSIHVCVSLPSRATIISLNFNFFLKLIFYMFFYYLDVLISKINFI
jgi:hypothetical protein